MNRTLLEKAIPLFSGHGKQKWVSSSGIGDMDVTTCALKVTRVKDGVEQLSICLVVFPRISASMWQVAAFKCWSWKRIWAEAVNMAYHSMNR